MEEFEYDRVAYPGAAARLIHPRHMELVAQMFGLQPAPLQNCRVLEVGCADGASLLPYAEAFPNASFVGIDLAEQRIHEARSVAQATGLQNIEFHMIGVSEVDQSFGHFDYILVPGVYSWTTDTEREAILRVCRENLSDNGVAAISFNVLPGWHFRAAVREFIQRHVRSLPDPKQQVAEARRVVDFLATSTRPDSPENISYRDLQRVFQAGSDHYVYHDFISTQNEPFYFHEFVTSLVDNQLQFVTECDIRHTTGMGLTQTARAAIDSAPVFDREQLIDFVSNTCYRRSLICHSAKRVTRRLDHTSMHDMHFTLSKYCDPASFNPAEPGPLTLTFGEGTMTTVEPLGKAALQFLMEIWPGSADLNAVLQAVHQRLPAQLVTVGDGSSADGDRVVLGRSLLAAYAAGAIKACKTPPRLSTDVTEFPVAGQVARYMASIGGNVVNQWHRNLGVLKPDENFVLGKLDGSNRLCDIEVALEAFRESKGVAVSSLELPRTAAQIVDAFAKDALLLGDA